MSYDLKRTVFSVVREKEVATGTLIDQEGLVLVHTLENGIGKVTLPTPAATEIVVGFATTDNDTHKEKPAVESHVVPAAAPLTVTLNQAVPQAATFYIYDETAATALVNGNPANPGEYSVAGNVVTFNAAEAGNTVTVSYKYDLTVAQVIQTYYERNINRKASQVFEQVAYGTGDGIIYLDNYDTTQDYSTFAVGEGLIVLAGGIVSKGTVAGALALPGHVIHVPNVDNPQLGIEFSIPMV